MEVFFSNEGQVGELFMAHQSNAVPNWRKPISAEQYQRIYLGWRRKNSGQRWGQYLCNSLNLTEAQAPGLFYAVTFHDASRIFNDHFYLE